MKRNAIILLLLAAVFTGCGNKNEDPERKGGSSAEKETEAVSQLSAEEYYDTYSEKVIEVVEAEEYDNVFSEAGSAELFAERGFTDYPVTYDYSIDGEKLDETEVDAGSEEKHPIYQTYFVTENGTIWVVYLIGDEMSADPFSYNLASDSGKTLMLSESEEFLSYDCDENKFYRTVPSTSVVTLCIADEISADVLEEFTKEELE